MDWEQEIPNLCFPWRILHKRTSREKNIFLCGKEVSLRKQNKYVAK